MSDIKFPKDFKIRGGYEKFFYCPKCNCSVVSYCENEKKQNTISALDEENQEGDMTFVLECRNCHYIDLLEKFLKIKEEAYNMTNWKEQI
jgi:transcription elongation factor Elf1